jgi:hypothetical protein
MNNIEVIEGAEKFYLILCPRLEIFIKMSQLESISLRELGSKISLY